MITREILAELIGFAPEPYLTTTLYLRIEGSIKPSYMIELKDLIKARRKDLDSLSLSNDVRNSVQSDLKEIQDYVALKFSRDGVRTLVITSCSARKWWREMRLNLPLRNRLTVGSHPDYKPMALMLEEHYRFVVALVERSKAKLFEVFAGDILEHSSILDEVPGKVRMGGFSGYQEKRIARHIEDHVRRHYGHVANSVYDLYKRHSCDYLILAGSETNTSEFRHHLHGTLQERIAAVIPEEIHASPAAVLQKTGEVESALKQAEERKLLDRFFDQVNSGGLGIVGLDSTVRALQNGQVNCLLIRDGFEEPGFRCLQCGGLHTSNGHCRLCGDPLQKVEDVVEEAVQEALHQGCQVKYITVAGSRLDSTGKIGAMLRFKV